jgi:hypothetical protein
MKVAVTRPTLRKRRIDFSSVLSQCGATIAGVSACVPCLVAMVEKVGCGARYVIARHPAAEKVDPRNWHISEFRYRSFGSAAYA